LIESLLCISTGESTSEALRAKSSHIACAATQAACHAAVFLDVREELRESLNTDFDRLRAGKLSRKDPIWRGGRIPAGIRDCLEEEVAIGTKTAAVCDRYREWLRGFPRAHEELLKPSLVVQDLHTSSIAPAEPA
jgi:hypothetical protein